MFLPYLVVEESAHLYRLLSLDFIFEKKKKIWNQHINISFGGAKFYVFSIYRKGVIEFLSPYQQMPNRIRICPDFGGKIFIMKA